MFFKVFSKMFLPEMCCAQLTLNCRGSQHLPVAAHTAAHTAAYTAAHTATN